MDATLISLLVGLATVLTSGVASSIVTYRLNRQKEHVFFMRQKAESLYLAADEYGRALSCNIISYFPVVRGEIDYNEMLDIQMANPPSKEHGGYETLAMLVGIYFPEVESKLKILEEVRDRLSKLRNEHNKAYKNGGGVDRYWDAAFSDVTKELDCAIKALKSAILHSARRYGGNSPDSRSRHSKVGTWLFLRHPRAWP